MKFPLGVVLTTLLTLVLAVPLFVGQQFVHGGLENRFRDYLGEHLHRVHAQIMDDLEASTLPQGGLEPGRVRELGQDALRKGLLITVDDDQGRRLWSPEDFDRSASQDIVNRLAQSQSARYPSLSGHLVEASHPLYHHDQVVGTMKTFVYEPWNLAPEDVEFLAQVDALFWAAEAVGLALAFLLGLGFARQLTRQLAQVSRVATQVGRGDYEGHRLRPSAIREVFELQTTIEGLKTGLEFFRRQRRLRVEETAHELRTPLANLDSQLEALEDGLLTPDGPRFASMRGEVERLKRLVEDWELLDDAEAGEITLDLEAVDVALVGEHLGLSFAGRFAQRAQVWAVDLPPGFTVETDRRRLLQILVNLVENAHRYSGQGTTITLSGRRRDRGWALEVRDDGAGISAADLPRVTERLYRGEASRNRQLGGAGLGLAVASALTRALGGTLAVESPPGQGTTCRIEFPL